MSEEIKNDQVVEEVNENLTVEVPANKPESKTFTQEELDKIVADRIAREKKKLEKFADYDEIKTKAAEYEKALEEKRLAELTEKERAEEIAKKAEEEKAELAKQLEDLRKANEQEKITNEFIKVATSKNVAYIEDALRLADLSAVTFEDGKVVGVEDVVNALVENKPFLVATKKQPKQIGEATNSTSDKSEKSAEQLLAEAADKAKRSGRVEDKVAYATLKAQLKR
jgi:hypothetical protein